MADPKEPLSPVARRDRAYAGHVCLCASMLVWRTIEATPSLASTQNGSWPSSPLGVAATMILICLGVASLVAAVAFTFLALEDPRLWMLFALMSLSMLWRREIDVFDISYVALVAVLSVWWFNAGRFRAEAALEARARSSGGPCEERDPSAAR